MKITGMLRLAQRDLQAAMGRSIMAAFGIGLGIGSLTLVIALGLGVEDLVLKEIVHELPLDMVEVIPKTLDLGLFAVDASRFLGGASITPETVEKLGRLPQVAAIYPKLEINLPMGAQGGAKLFGRNLRADLFMTGIPTELVQAEVPEGFVDNPQFIPVVVSDQLLEIYNTSVAPVLGAPKLTRESLIGFEFDMVVGQSLLLGNRGAKAIGKEAARIVGVSRYALRLGVSVPLGTGERLLQKYADGTIPPRYASLLVRIREPKEIPLVVQAVEGMGLAVDETARRTRGLLVAATALGAGLGFLVLTLAALNIAHSFFAMLSERRRELAVLRALGASRAHVLLLVLCQAAALGLLGGVLGWLGARLTALGIDVAAATWLADLPFKPASFFVFSGWLGCFAVAVGILAALLGAAAPAWRFTSGAVLGGLDA